MTTQSREIHQVHLRLTCSPMPALNSLRWGEIRLVQRRDAHVIMGTPRADGAISFDWNLRVRYNPNTGAPRFVGSEIAGVPERQCLALSWERHEAGEWEMFRRIKVHLSPITWSQVQTAVQKGELLEAMLSAVGRDNSPACASIPLVGGGWFLAPG